MKLFHSLKFNFKIKETKETQITTQNISFNDTKSFCLSLEDHT